MVAFRQILIQNPEFLSKSLIFFESSEIQKIRLRSKCNVESEYSGSDILTFADIVQVGHVLSPQAEISMPWYVDLPPDQLRKLRFVSNLQNRRRFRGFIPLETDWSLLLVLPGYFLIRVTDQGPPKWVLRPVSEILDLLLLCFKQNLVTDIAALGLWRDLQRMLLGGLRGRPLSLLAINS